jgi:hypothetical protein
LEGLLRSRPRDDISKEDHHSDSDIELKEVKYGDPVSTSDLKPEDEPDGEQAAPIQIMQVDCSVH